MHDSGLVDDLSAFEGYLRNLRHVSGLHVSRSQCDLNKVESKKLCTVEPEASQSLRQTRSGFEVQRVLGASSSGERFSANHDPYELLGRLQVAFLFVMVPSL